MSGRHLLLRQDWKAAELKAHQPDNAFTQHGSPLWTRAFGHYYLTRKQIELQPCGKVSIGYRERQGCKSPHELTFRMERNGGDLRARKGPALCTKDPVSAKENK